MKTNHIRTHIAALIAFCFLLSAFQFSRAQTPTVKGSALPVASSVSLTDRVVMIIDPSGTPITKAATLTTISSLIGVGDNSVTSAKIVDGAIVNADINASAAIAYSKLALTGAILNADLAGSIAMSKLAALTASRLVVTDGSGNFTVSAVTSTEAGYLSGVTSAIQTQLNDKLATATAASTYQPLNARLTGIGNLTPGAAEKAVLLEADGTMSTKAYSYGGNGSADAGLIPEYSSGGTLYAGGVGAGEYGFIGSTHDAQAVAGQVDAAAGATGVGVIGQASSLTGEGTGLQGTHNTATGVAFLAGGGAGQANLKTLGDGTTILGGGTSSSEFRFLEPSGSGSNYFGFKPQAMADNAVFTLPATDGTSGQALVTNGSKVLSFASVGTGTVTSASVVTANGVSGTVATATTTPAITLSLGAITPTTVNGNTFTAGTGTLTFTGSSTLTVPATGTAALLGTANVFTASQTFPAGSAAAPSVVFTSSNGGIYSAGVGRIDVVFSSSGKITFWSDGSIYQNDTAAELKIGNRASLFGDATNILALKNGTSAQTFRVYGTTTGSKYLSLSHDGTNGVISASSGAVTFTTPPRLPVYTVATLPSTAATGMVTGAEAYVTDATAPTYLGTLTGGGAVVCPVFYDGTNWVSH